MQQLTILFENEDFLVIDKPTHVVMHPYDFSTEETILDVLLTKYKEMLTIKNTFTLQDGRTIPLGGIVHRLDRDTSGTVVIAKTNEAFLHFRALFQAQQVTKHYIALVEGIVKEPTFTISGPLGRNKKEYKQSLNPKNPRGALRHSHTDGMVMAHNKTTTLVKLSPLTGRTHQLRAHMAHLCHPIVGDKAYGGTIASERIMLHAESLSFVYKEKDYTFSSPMPATFFDNNA